MKTAKNGRKPKQNLVKELDAAIALLTRVRELAASANASEASEPSSAKGSRRVLSASAREAIAAAQRRRWAKVRRQKKQAARSAQ